MSSQGLIIKSDITSIIPRGKVWADYKRNRVVYSSEEHLFNRSTIKFVEGVRCRVTSLFFSSKNLEINIDALVNSNAIKINEFLKRVITPDAPFTGYSNGKRAIAGLTQLFKEQLKATLAEGKPGHRLLLNEEAYKVTCDIVSIGPDPYTYEGTNYIEFRWYAESVRDGKDRRRPIVHVYNSQVKK